MSTNELTTTEKQLTPFDQVLANPDMLERIDAAKLRELFEMQKEQRAHIAELEFTSDFVGVQEEMQKDPVVKNGRNNHTNSHYAKLEDVCEKLTPRLLAHGFAASASADDCPRPDYQRFTLVLRHKAGHKEVHFFDVPIDDKGLGGKTNKTGVQGWRSSWSYGHRSLLLCHVFNIPVVGTDH